MRPESEKFEHMANIAKDFLRQRKAETQRADDLLAQRDAFAKRVDDLVGILEMITSHCECSYGHDGMPCKGCEALADYLEETRSMQYCPWCDKPIRDDAVGGGGTHWHKACLGRAANHGVSCKQLTIAGGTDIDHAALLHASREVRKQCEGKACELDAWDQFCRVLDVLEND